MKTINLLTALMLVAGLVLVVGPVPMAQAATSTIEVSQPTHLTSNSEYDRNPSIIHDGSDYWLFYTKGDDTSTSGVRGGSYDPDGDTYVVYYKTASTIAGLASASETKLGLSETSRPANFDQRVVSATYFNSKVYAFVSSGQSGTDRGLYYYEYGGSWSGPTTLIADATARGGHVNVTSDTSRVYIVWESSDGSSDCYTWDETNGLSTKIDISTDNQPKITLMGTTLYVVSIEDGTGDIEVYSVAAGASPSFSPHSTAIPGAGLYDPCIFNDGTNLYVVTAPYIGAEDRQYLVQTKYSGSWATAKKVSYGGYGSVKWWDYWPIGYHDGSDAYLFLTTETASPTYSDGEIAYIKMDWNLGNDHYFYIQNAVDQASAGDTINVAAGTYSEGVALTPGKDLTIVGAGRDVVTWICPSDGYCIAGNMQGYTGGMNYEISDFTFNCRDNPATGWSAGIGIYKASNGPLNLSIHDNRFVEDRASGDDTHWATSMFLCHNRYAARDGSGSAAVRVYNNIDETWGGMTMSNSQAYDIYNNVFDGCSDAIYNGHGCPDVAGQTFGDHHIYGNTFMNASDALHPSGLTPAIDWQYYGAGGGTHLPSIIEENVFEDNDTAMRFIMDTDMTYPAHVVRNNCFIGNDLAIRVDGDHVSILNAENNWWGDISGPTHSGNPGGTGDAVSDHVDYDPWLTLSYTGETLFSKLDSVSLQATLSSSEEGVTVDFYVDDGHVGSDTTDVNGVATLILGTKGVGVYAVTARAGGCLVAEALVVVYDPTAGFVTGGGWIDSPEGAYMPDPSLTGKATFGFVAKYKKGAQTPEGQTEFVFKVADLNFHSDNYEWLVVAGSKAQFKGTGTINGPGNYGFMLTAVDAELTPSTEVDKFRIKIWNKATDELVYDNQMGGADNADLTTRIGGGSVVIHTKKTK